jgi:thiol-disulfide isomerase/thioredoxin
MKVLKFGAVWCPGCIIMKPRWEEVEKENTWLETEYFEYDDSAEQVKNYNVGKDIPVFIFLDKDGNELDRLKGEVSKENIIETINKYKDK